MNKYLNQKRGMSNRGIILIISIIIIIIVTIVIIANNKSSNVKYGNEEIKKLLNNGVASMQNFYVEEYDVESGTFVKSIWFKDNMRKIKTTEDGYSITDFNLEKMYLVSTVKKKVIVVNFPSEDRYGPYILKEELSEEVKYEYIKEEKYQDKDCIVVKEVGVDVTTGNELEGQSLYQVFWMEKDTGHLIGRGEIYKDKEGIVENVCYKNIKVNEVLDSEFEIPKNFVITKK